MNQRILVVGSNNRKKRKELVELLDIEQIELRALRDFDPVDEVVEDGESFMENAMKKASGYARALRQWVVADDSGLVVDALGGAPGIYSARYAGEPTDDEQNIDRLLRELANVPDEERTAHFVCAAAVADPDGVIRAEAEGRCDGRIVRRRSGDNGFGYDPVFLIPDEGLTFGELSAEFKRAKSHRAVAMQLLRPKLLALIEYGQW